MSLATGVVVAALSPAPPAHAGILDGALDNAEVLSHLDALDTDLADPIGEDVDR
ncbi:hypothetical protein [Streptomyces sp. NPDC006879]|uniref:hypothetical protein n=1 Tax=Streptomyces sp. NPDC006879 TaxID=3364767 RepID=UPI0036A1962F